MKRKEGVKYFDKLWRRMQRRLKKYLKKEQAEDLHAFRVKVKKIRAFIALAESEENSAYLKQYFKPVKKLFGKAGEIRTADLNLGIAKEHFAEPKLIYGQTLARNKALEAFKPVAVKKLAKFSAIRKRLQKRIKPISDVHINLFYQENLKQIGTGIENISFDDRLHSCRKQMKVLLYDYHLVAPVLHVGFNSDYLHDVQTAIGDWHDSEDAKALFKEDRKALTGINKNSQKLKTRVKRVVKDMYNRATIAPELALPQIS